MRTSSGLTSILLLLALPALAVAQPEADKPAPTKPDATKPGTGAGEEVEMGEDDAPIADETGMEENPDAPTSGNDGTDTRVVMKAPPAPVVYPVESHQRPITLLAGMSEGTLDYPVFFDPFRTAGQLRAAYGITSKIEAQLRYGIGSYSNDASKYYPGKAVALGGVYQVMPFVGAQLELPILLDPFAMGVTLGAPLKFRFDKFALFAGRDLVTFKLAKFAPIVEDTLATEALTAAHEVNAILPDGTLRITGGIIYALKPTMSITGETGIVAVDFKGDQADWLLRASLTMESKRFDYGARLGIEDLDNAGETINLALFGSVRI